jgi:hypothetical protein
MLRGPRAPDRLGGMRGFFPRGEIFHYARAREGGEMTIKAPANLSKEARGIFKKIMRVRGDAAMPIVPGEVDLVADYAAVRQRLLKLGEFLETDAVKASPHSSLQQ